MKNRKSKQTNYRNQQRNKVKKEEQREKASWWIPKPEKEKIPILKYSVLEKLKEV